jgi:hypothetical protein
MDEIHLDYKEEEASEVQKQISVLDRTDFKKSQVSKLDEDHSESNLGFKNPK